jgi:Ca2+-binding EF-hand superfamily protein
MDVDKYLSRNVFERLYETQTNASRMKQNDAELPEGLKRTSSSFLEYSGNLTPSRFKSYTPAPRKMPPKEKSPSGVRSGPRRNSTEQIPQPRKLDYRRSLKFELTRHSKIPIPSEISGRKKSQSEKLVNADAKAKEYARSALPSTDFPSFEEVLQLFRHLDVGGKGLLPISELEMHLAKVYPGLRYRALAVDSYGNKGGSLAEVDFPYFLLYVLYFNSVWDEFTLFENDDEWRVSKKEYTPVAKKLGLFEDVEETWNSIHPDGDGFARLQAFCDACAKKKLDLLTWDNQQGDSPEIVSVQGKENVDVGLNIIDDALKSDDSGANNLNSTLISADSQDEPTSTDAGADTLNSTLISADSQDEPTSTDTGSNALNSTVVSADSRDLRTLIDSDLKNNIGKKVTPINVPPLGVLITTFDQYDREKKGMMGLDQLNHLVASEYPELNNGSAMIRAIAFADKDRDGNLLRSEFPVFCEYAARYSSLWNQLGGGENRDAEISRAEAIDQVKRITGMDVSEAMQRMMGSQQDSVRLDDICAWCSSEVVYNDDDAQSDTDTSDASSTIGNLLKTIQARHGGPGKNGDELPPMEVLMRIFDLIDVKGRGKVNYDQLDRYIKKYRPKWYYEPALEKGFALADRRERGYVRRHKFPVFYQFVSYHSKFLENFKAKDDNVNRSVRHDEFRAVAQRLGVTI